MSFHFLYIYLSFYFFRNAFLPKITLGPWQGVWMGVGYCSFVSMATGPKSDVQWAKKWRTVGQNVTYAGLKSDVRAKMQHWGVIICIHCTHKTVKIILQHHAFKMLVIFPRDSWGRPGRVHAGEAKVVALCIELVDLSLFIRAITG